MKEEKKPRKKLDAQSLGNLKKLYVYVKPYQGMFFLGLVFLFLSSAANLLFPKILGDLVDAVSAEDFISKINKLGFYLILVLLAQAVFSFFRIVIFVRVAEKSLASLRQATFRQLIYLPIQFYNERRVGELNSRISSDIGTLQEIFTTTLAEFIRQLIIIFGGISLLAYTSWKLTLFMLAILPPVMLAAVVFGKFIRKYGKKVQDHLAESQTIVEESLSGILNVKVFVNELFEIDRYKKSTDEVARVAIKGGIYRGSFASFIILGLFGALVAVIWKGTTLIATGGMETGQLFSFIIYSGFIGGSIGGMADVYARLQKALGASEELLKIFDETTEPKEQNEDQNLILASSIAFKNVRFAYPSRPELEVIKGLHFSIHEGGRIALVGQSGGGKSTTASLLLKLYDNYQGEIWVGDRELKTLSPYQLRKNIAAVPQEILLFGGSIQENIAYGKPGSSLEEIQDAARKANAHEFIESFPNKYHTIVGERGIQLSGGQRQRIAIARAILNDPKILILDEATSALDSESEKLVQDALENLMNGRTSLVIAHRLSTVRNADRIVVLEEGKAVEQGTHEELMKAENGKYRSWYLLQNN